MGGEATTRSLSVTVQTSVDLLPSPDVCAAGTHNCRSDQVCVYNSISGHTCICAPGYMRKSDGSSECLKIPYYMFGELQSDGTYQCPSWLKAANIGGENGTGRTITEPNACRCPRSSLERPYMVPAPAISACVNDNGFSEKSVLLIIFGVLVGLLPGVCFLIAACLIAACNLKKCIFFNSEKATTKLYLSFSFLFLLTGCLMIPFGTRDKQCFSGVDECALGTHACPPTFGCINSECGYQCQCVSGTYETTGTEGDSDDAYYCADVDECLRGKKTCSSGYECQNSWKTAECVDIDECTRKTHNCQGIYWKCSNTAGSYNCLALSNGPKIALSISLLTIVAIILGL